MTTWNPSDKGSNITLTNSNLTAAWANSSNNSTIRSVDSYTTGKYYWEATFNGVNSTGVGYANSSALLNSMSGVNAVLCFTNAGGIYVNQFTTAAATIGAFSTGGLCCIAIDIGANLIWFRNGAAGQWNGSGSANPATGVGGISISAIAALGFYAFAYGQNAPTQITANFGDTAFTGAVPAGFTAGIPSAIPANRVSTAYVEAVTSGAQPANRVSALYNEIIGSPGQPANRISTLYNEVIGSAPTGQTYSLAASQGAYSLFSGAPSLYGMGLYGMGLYSGAVGGAVLGVGEPAAQGSYALTGGTATLTYSARSFYTLAATAGGYALTGQAVTLAQRLSHSLAAAAGTYSAAGAGVTFLRAGTAGGIAVPSIPYALTGGAVTLSRTPAALVGKAQKPYLREGTYRVRQLGWAFDPAFVLRKDRPGPIRIIEFDGWMSG